MTHTRNLLTGAFIGLLPFQDLGLRNTSLGILGASPSALPLLCLVLLSSCQWLLRARWRVPASAVALVSYVLAINAVSFLRFGVHALGTNLVSKTLTMSAVTFLWLFVVFGIDYSSFPRIGVMLKIAFLLLALGIVFGDLNTGGLSALVNNSFLHGTVNTDQRWRGLTGEASQLSTASVSIGLLAAHYAKRHWSRLCLAASALAVMVISGSKGGILTLGLTALILATTTGVKLRQILKISVIAVPLLYFASIRLAAVSDSEMLRETTTIATRSTAAVWGMITLSHNPQGVGFGGYYAELERSIPCAMDLVYRYSPLPLNFEEVRTYAISPENATSKVFFLDVGLLFGLPFLAWFAVVMWRQVKTLPVNRYLLLLISFWYITVAMCSYTNAPTAYSLFLVFGVVVSEARKFQNSACCERLPVSTKSRRTGRHLEEAPGIIVSRLPCGSLSNT